MARKLFRRVDNFTPIESTNNIRRPMPLGTTVTRYVCRLTGTLTTAVAAATILEDSPYGFIRNLDVVLNGSFPLHSLDGRGFFALNRFMQKTPPRVTPGTAGPGASAFFAEFTIDFGQLDLVPPLDSAFWLDTRLLSRLELVWTFGAAADTATAGGGGTIALSGLNMDVWAEEVADIGGPASRMQVSRIQQAIVATGDLDIQLPALGPAYRWLLLHYTSGNTDPLRATSDDTILNNVSLVGDNVVRHVDTAPYQMTRGDNKVLYNLETMPAGWAALDFARNKTLRDILLTNRTRQLILRQNIAAAPANSFVQIYPVNPLLVVRRGR